MDTPQQLILTRKPWYMFIRLMKNLVCWKEVLLLLKMTVILLSRQAMKAVSSHRVIGVNFYLKMNLCP